MNEFDIAHIYNECRLRSSIEEAQTERDFWFKLIEDQPNSSSMAYYKGQYERYNNRLRDLRNLLSDKFYDR
jgi:hypothetical protein